MEAEIVAGEADEAYAPEIDEAEDLVEATDDGGDEAEVEHDGRSYRVPAALKGAFLRHADYTRKTQEIAHQRRALEGERQEAAEMAELAREDGRDHARLEALEDSVADFEDYDWDLWFQQNPEQAQADWDRFRRTLAARDQVGGRLLARQRLRAVEAQRDHAMRLEHGHAELARDLEDWSPRLARELHVFGQSLGFSAEELSAVTDPRAVKVLYAAWRGAQGLQRQAAGRELERAQAVRPAPQVGGGASGPRDPARMSTAEWMRWRSEQTRRKAR